MTFYYFSALRRKPFVVEITKSFYNIAKFRKRLMFWVNVDVISTLARFYTVCC